MISGTHKKINPLRNSAGFRNPRRDDFIAMHGVEGNTNILAPLPGKKIYDMISGKALPVNKDNTVTVKLAPGETRLLECR